MAKVLILVVYKEIMNSNAWKANFWDSRYMRLRAKNESNPWSIASTLRRRRPSAVL